jgi:GNAT superfamily N-acetyltransferase
MAATVRRIRREDASELRRLRLLALATDPLAFGSTSSREEAYPPSDWTDRAGSGSEGDREAIFLVVGSDGAAYGMVGAFSNEGAKNLWGMWVAPACRGSGGGAALLGAVLDWCTEVAPDGPVRLEVNPAQVEAVRLYERAGFQATGETRTLGHHAPAVVQRMERLATWRARGEERPGSPRRSSR